METTQMFFIEFIGPPGVGKSTIHKELAKRLRRIDQNRYLTMEEAFTRVSRLKIDKIYRYILWLLPSSLAKKFSYKLKNRSLMQFYAQNRYLAQWGKSLNAYLTSSEFDNMSINERTMVISAFMTISSLYESLTGKLPPQTVIFMEEGLIQKTFMFISPLDKKYKENPKVLDYLDNIPLPHVAIYVKSDLKSCYQRMLSRPEGLTQRLSGFDKSDIYNFLKISQEHLQHVMNTLKEKNDVKFLEVNNSGNLEETICFLEKEIKSIFESQKNIQL